MPAGLFDEWDAQRALKNRPRTAPTVTTLENADRLAAYATATLRSACAELAAAPEGTRNDTCNRTGLRLHRMAVAGWIDADLVDQGLGDADGGLDHPATRATLHSAREAAARIGPADPPPDRTTTDPFNSDARYEGPVGTVTPPSGPHSPGRDPAETETPTVTGVPDRIDWRALWNEPDGDDWILEPLIPARRLVAVYSAPKVGKSLLLLELAAAVSRGERVLGARPDRPYRVLYVDHENDPRGDIRGRLQAMGYGPADLDNLAYLSFPPMGTLDSERGGRELLAAALHYEAEVVIVDTASRTVAGSENENDTWLGWYRHTGALLKRAGIAVVRLDHTGKDVTLGMRGGSAKSSDVDAAWLMTRLTDRADGVPETFRLKLDLSRMRIAEDELTFERREDPLRHAVLPGARRSAFDAKVAEVIACADRAGLPRDAGRPAIEQAVRDASISVGKTALTEATRRRKTAPDPRGQLNLTDCPPWEEGITGQSAA